MLAKKYLSCFVLVLISIRVPFPFFLSTFFSGSFFFSLSVEGALGSDFSWLESGLAFGSFGFSDFLSGTIGLGAGQFSSSVLADFRFKI